MIVFQMKCIWIAAKYDRNKRKECSIKFFYLKFDLKKWLRECLYEELSMPIKKSVIYLERALKI